MTVLQVWEVHSLFVHCTVYICSYRYTVTKAMRVMQDIAGVGGIFII